MLLAVDTSTRTIGVAIYDGVRVRSEMTWISKNHHTIELAPCVTRSIAHIGATVREIQAVGVAIGPGSFTGLRIGLAFAKGLALSNRIPIVGIPTLNILAAGLPVHPELKLAALLEAGRRRLAVQVYKGDKGKWQPEDDLVNLTIEEFTGAITEPILISGELTGESRHRIGRTKGELFSPVQCVRRPAVLAELAWMRWQAKDIDDPTKLKPIYLHHGDPIPG
jgi:tRNA threonylcarbamoyladenosine biosynthesis protein TsaB